MKSEEWVPTGTVRVKLDGRCTFAYPSEFPDADRVYHWPQLNGQVGEVAGEHTCTDGHEESHRYEVWFRPTVLIDEGPLVMRHTCVAQCFTADELEPVMGEGVPVSEWMEGVVERRLAEEVERDVRAMPDVMRRWYPMVEAGIAYHVVYMAGPGADRCPTPFASSGHDDHLCVVGLRARFHRATAAYLNEVEGIRAREMSKREEKEEC